jgi:hypothetical protein
MQGKRARHVIFDDEESQVRRTRIHRILHDKNTPMEAELNRTPVQQRSFFESAAVYAWYNGSGEPITTVSTINPTLLSTESTQEAITSLHEPVVDNFARESQEYDAIGAMADSNLTCDLPIVSDHKVLDVDGDGDLLSEVELENMDSSIAFEIPTLECLNMIEQEAIKVMMSASEEMKPCCVCELSCLRSDIVKQELTDKYIQVGASTQGTVRIAI